MFKAGAWCFFVARLVILSCLFVIGFIGFLVAYFAKTRSAAPLFRGGMWSRCDRMFALGFRLFAPPPTERKGRQTSLGTSTYDMLLCVGYCLSALVYVIASLVVYVYHPR